MEWAAGFVAFLVVGAGSAYIFTKITEGATGTSITPGGAAFVGLVTGAFAAWVVGKAFGDDKRWVITASHPGGLRSAPAPGGTTRSRPTYTRCSSAIRGALGGTIWLADQAVLSDPATTAKCELNGELGVCHAGHCDSADAPGSRTERRDG